MSIIGLVIKSLKEFDENSENFFSVQSRKNVVAGKIYVLLETILKVVFIIVYVVIFAFIK
jgi:hypothetical protein